MYPDKLLHFIVSGYLFLIPTLILTYPWPGIVLALSWGLWKELKDKKFDWWDIVADLSGILFANLIWAF